MAKRTGALTTRSDAGRDGRGLAGYMSAQVFARVVSRLAGSDRR